MGSSDDSGADLVARWRAGDKTAFGELFRAYRSLVRGTLFHLLRGDPDIDDVVQTTFLEVFRSLDRFEGRSKLSSWITRIALHVGFHHLRGRRRAPARDDGTGAGGDASAKEPAGGDDPHDTMERAEAVRRIYAVLQEMAPKKRVVFILNDLQGRPQDEIAEVVGTNVATVRTRLFHARREFWERAGGDPVLATLVPSDALSPRRHGT